VDVGRTRISRVDELADVAALVGNSPRISLVHYAGSAFDQRLCGITRVLRQAP